MAYTFEWQKSDKRSSSTTRRKIEKLKIKKHKPDLNKSCGGEGPLAKRKKSTK
ncbi:MAG: hypothetical protein RBS89_07330 [Candidatus Delongbacteria bacterium]|jgi:hypothetical protein|nr:hypothetical protein [Candidatus Delongbacteria bacterium]